MTHDVTTDTNRRPNIFRDCMLALAFAVVTGDTALAQTTAPPASLGAGALVRGFVSAGSHAKQRWPLLTDVRRDLATLYDASGDTLLWSHGGQPTPSALLVVQQLALLNARGLDPADYDAASLQQLAAAPVSSAQAQADFDVTLTTAALRALRALRYGRVSARIVHAQLGFDRETYDISGAVRAMTTATNPALAFDQAEPPFLHYHLLKNAMARYRALARDTSLTSIVIARTLKSGATDSGMPPLRRLLTATGDLAAVAEQGGADSFVYDSVTVAGVRRFQLRQGFAGDGVIGPATLARLRRSFPARIAQMELTLERWRWLPHDLGDPPPIIVNVPAFRLHAFTTSTDREADLISMDVVVGDAFNHKTPVFSGALQYLVFSPYWDVPPSITRKELLPKARRDGGYLARGNYEVVSNGGAVLGTAASAVAAVAAGRARIRQKPGATNSLGRVKFIFPNAFNVYLHDTPAQSVFERARRDASHGCIRVADPVRLARFLLADQAAWDSTAIVAAMSQLIPRQVNLTRRIPVHIVYATTVAREDGVVLFYDDIYGHDRTLSALLAKGYPYSDGGR